MRKPISSVLLPKHPDRGPQIGVVKHPSSGNHASIRRSEAQDKNDTLRAVIDALEKILPAGLARDAHVGVGDWRRDPTTADLPAELRDIVAPDPEQFEPKPLKLLEQLSPSARTRHAEAVEEGAARYRKALADWELAKEHQAQALADLRDDIQAENRRLADLERALKAGEPEAVEWYAHEVLTKSPYPRRLERKIETSLDRASRTLHVRMGLPPVNHVVPAAEAFKYVKPIDEIKEIDRTPEERAALYDRVVAQLALRSLHEIFSTDPGDAITAVALSIDVISVDPATGHDTIAPLLSLAVTKAAFMHLDLSRVDPVACVHRLMAPSP
jgi:restriction system protein